MAVGITDTNGKVLMENGALATIWAGNLPLNDVPDYAKYKAWWSDTGKAVEPEDWPAAKALKGETSTVLFDIQKFDGTRGAVIVSAVPLLDEDGNITGTVWINEDITELRRAEKDLRRSNEELQQFAFVASHDMQEHLRMITMHLGVLNKRFGSDIDPRAKEHMEYVNAGAERMRQLVDDPLQYSRIEAQPGNLTQVDMNKVADLAIKDLRVSIDEANAEVMVEHLPTVMANELQMSQVLENLISNAIKFRRSDVKPRVEVSAIRYENEFVFAVKDNGIGIDAKYADKLFKMFSRLHTKEEYPGTGIGLAIAKKIVEKNGGQMWFEGEPGKGTKFYFTVPTK